MYITLIRHLPTEWNKKQKLQGRQDIDISIPTEEFIKGIHSNQKLLKKIAPFDLVLASTLKRTRQTANLYGFEPESEALLDELDFGPFEGGPKERLTEALGDKWIESPKGLVLGESLENFEKRITAFLEKYRTYSNILVFGHGSWIRGMISYNRFDDINRMNKIHFLNNACITLQF